MPVLTPKHFARYLNEASQLRKPSAIRALQPLLSIPGMISLGGGMPNSDTFPITEMSFKYRTDPNGANGTGIEEVTIRGNDMDAAMQYSPSQGMKDLQNALLDLIKKEHNPPSGIVPTLATCVTTGSQDALSKAFENLVGPEKGVFVESPCYSGTLAALAPLRAEKIEVPADSDGIDPDALKALLKGWDAQNPSKPMPNVLYLIATGSNPSGGSLTLDRKKKIYALAQEYDLLIMEDDPYYYMQFAETRTPSFLSLDEDGRVLRFGSFSKTISSGLRIGMVCGHEELVNRVELTMQASELHTSGISQMVLLSLLRAWASKGDGFERHIAMICEFYRRRRDVMIAALEKHLTGHATWGIPKAGMFVWIKLDGISDSKTLIEQEAREAKVILIPGQVFMPNGQTSNHVRASYSTATDEQIDTAIGRLADILRNHQ
eukprot:Clim_evm73s210 gene=Clim_evmTU73s210